MSPRSVRGAVACAALLALAGCTDQLSHQIMAAQPKHEPLEASGFFADGGASRELVPGTVARGHLDPSRSGLPVEPRTEPAGQEYGKARGHAHASDGQPHAAGAADGGNAGAGDQHAHEQRMPFPLTRAVLERGRDRFNIFCAPCHGRTGYGDGLVVRRGFTSPPSFHTEQMRQHPVSHFYRIATEGVGAMPEYAKQTRPEDRWAIAAYIRALQLSQHAPVAAVPPEARERLADAKEAGR